MNTQSLVNEARKARRRIELMNLAQDTASFVVIVAFVVIFGMVAAHLVV